MSGPSPVVVLYSKPGCGLCVEARDLLDALLADRARAGLAAPPVEERDITTDPAWEAAFFLEIPVVEVGDRRLALATSAARLRRLLADALDPVTA
jgi:glutaredoxin